MQKCGCAYYKTIAKTCDSITIIGDSPSGWISRDWIDDRFHFTDRIDREPACLCMLPHHFFAFRDVNAIDLVLGNKGLNPMIRLAHLDNGFAGGLGNGL